MGAKLTRTGFGSTFVRGIRLTLQERTDMLKDIGSAARDHGRLSITSSTDAETGEGFPPLAESTLRKGPRISPQPLMRTGALLDSIAATEPRGDKVSISYLWYGVFHNLPAVNQVRRRFITTFSLVPGVYSILRTFLKKTIAGQVYKIGDGG